MARRKSLKSEGLKADGLPDENAVAGAGAPPDDVAAAPRIESPEIVPPQFEAHPADDAFGPAAYFSDADIPHAEPSRSDMHHMELPPLGPAEPLVSAQTIMQGDIPPPSRFARIARFSPLAATIAVAAALGAMAGSLTTAGVTHFVAADPAPAGIADVAAAGQMKDSLARLDAELAAVKAGLDQSGKAHATQISKIAERLDRAEKARAETPAKLEKITETLDRLEKRAAAPVVSAPEVTGAISSGRAVAAPLSPDAKAPVLNGWTLRDVYNGAAMIQGQRYGILEVIPGDNIPGVGRVETIRRVDGRWVVMTSKGIIVGR